MFLMSNYCLYVLVRSSSYTTTITISHHCGWNGLFVLVIVIVIVIVIVWVCSWTRVIHDTPFVVAIAVAVVVCTVDLVVLPNQLGLPCIHITHIGTGTISFAVAVDGEMMWIDIIVVSPHWINITLHSHVPCRTANITRILSSPVNQYSVISVTQNEWINVCCSCPSLFAIRRRHASLLPLMT